MESNDADNDPYSRLIPREKVHVGSADSDGDEAVDGDETPRNQSLSGPTTPGVRRERERDLERERIYAYLSCLSFHVLYAM